MTRYAIVPNARAAIAAVDHTMTNPDTDTLKALLEKATPGPWKIEHEKASALGPKFDGPVVYAEDCETHYVADFSQNHSCRLEYEAISNAKLAAASPALAAETISLRERVKELEGVLSLICGSDGYLLSHIATFLGGMCDAHGVSEGKHGAIVEEYYTKLHEISKAARALKKETK
jgi:hypothetical protein